jgi:hypothetical protein
VSPWPRAITLVRIVVAMVRANPRHPPGAARVREFKVGVVVPLQLFGMSRDLASDRIHPRDLPVSSTSCSFVTIAMLALRIRATHAHEFFDLLLHSTA